jgi:hypothetical protein
MHPTPNDIFSTIVNEAFPRRKKYAFLTVTDSDIRPKDWIKYKKDVIICQGGRCYMGDRRVKIAERVVSNYDPSEYLLSHVTIIASVQTEDGPDKTVKYQDYYIHPDTSQFVNDNADAWEFKLLMATFRTFIGAENYLEHIQIPEYSRGKVLDAVPRIVKIKGQHTGKPVEVLYVDILVATHRSHEDLCRDILSGKVHAMSMGSTLDFSICSATGKVIFEEEDMSDALEENRGEYFKDDNGVPRRIAELCGHWTSPNSNRFVEASWVDTPAFGGAERRNILNEDSFKAANSIRPPRKWANDTSVRKMLRRAHNLSKHRQAADKLHQQENNSLLSLFQKAASKRDLVEEVLSTFCRE